MKAHRLHNGGREKQEKFIKERIELVEKHFSKLCSAFGGYTRKTAALRDKSDEVALTVHNYAETEDVNTSLKMGLTQFSSTLCGIGDYRDAQVHRLESKVVSKLTEYGGMCESAREVSKRTFSARDTEMARKRYLLRLRGINPRLTPQITQAELELSKASANVYRSSRSLREQMDMFEKKKLRDIRAILLDFVTMELSFNSKAVELFTKAYQDVSEINIEEDLKDFRRAVNVFEPVSRLDSLKKSSFTNNSSFLSYLFSKPSVFKRSELVPKLTQHSAWLKESRDDCSLKTGAGGLSILGAGDLDDDASLSRRCQTSPRSTQRFVTGSVRLNDRRRVASSWKTGTRVSNPQSGDDAEDESSSLPPEDGKSARISKRGSSLDDERISQTNRDRVSNSRYFCRS